ncbi:CREB-binding protein [Armadillidium vulgare]|nr:CREB-binding protein [Armadillidium vulgare]
MVIYEEKSNAPDPPEGGGRGMPNVSDPEKGKSIQKQLVLLLHAYQCRPAINDTCPILNCQLMKDVLCHMDTCQFGRCCQVPLCVSSFMLSFHWYACLKVHCSICGPISSFKDSVKCNGV